MGNRLRTDILAVTWPAGAKLSVRPLSERYNTSTTVAREALSHLAGDWLVQLKPNRGFFVTDLGATELTDLTELRCRVEEFGIALAIERGDLAWESQLIAAHHMMEGTPRRNLSPDRIATTWSDAHSLFHAMLLEPCGLDHLKSLAKTLADITLFYRQLAASTHEAVMRNVASEHTGILNATLARDTVKAGQLLREHYSKSLKVIIASGVLHAGDHQGDDNDD